MDNGQHSNHLLDLVSDFLQYHDFEQTVQALNAERQQRRQLLNSSIHHGSLPKSRAALKQSLVSSCKHKLTQRVVHMQNLCLLSC
jgi:hypothetical protein